MLENIKQLNWVDLLVLILLIRIGYITFKTGFSLEIFKFTGTIVAIYFACHYYSRISGFLSNQLFQGEATGLDFLNVVIFSLLAGLFYFIFVIIRALFALVIRIEAVSLLNRWGAFFIGMVRGLFFVGMLLFILSLSNISYLKNSVFVSYSGLKLSRLTPRVYTSLWNSIASRFVNEAAFNKDPFEVVQYTQ